MFKHRVVLALLLLFLSSVFTQAQTRSYIRRSADCASKDEQALHRRSLDF